MLNASKIKFQIFHEQFNLKEVFRISRGSKSHIETISVKIFDDKYFGIGECVPYPRYNETIQSVKHEIENFIENAIIHGRDWLNINMPAGAARNAIDCALWHYEANKQSKNIFEIANIPAPIPKNTAITISIDTIDKMITKSIELKDFPILKIKIADKENILAIKEIQKIRSDAKFIIDANEALNLSDFEYLLETINKDITICIEQPFKEFEDVKILTKNYGIPIFADESFHTSKDIEKLSKFYDGVNLKIDKSGGITEALKIIKIAREYNLQIMIGCMVGSSLVTAQAAILSSLVDYMDLDGPLLLKTDRNPSLEYNNALLYPPSKELWF